ncbi:MAG: hypothetical protein WCK18_15290 [Prolixibacteraceae bacterium]
MLENLITSKTRVKLLLKFFLNSSTQAHLRGLESEFGESTNAIRLELNRFEQAGMLTSHLSGNKKIFSANPSYPLFPEIQTLLRKHLGIDQVVEQVFEKLGEVDEVYLTGTFACGLESPNIEIVLVGSCVDTNYLENLIDKAEVLIKRNIIYSLLSKGQFQEHFAGLGAKKILLLWQQVN